MSLLSFFYILRNNGIPVTPKEWFDLYNLIKNGLIDSMDKLYFLGRSVLVKSEKLYDAYDKAFLEFSDHKKTLKDDIERIMNFFDKNVEPNFFEFLSDDNILEILERFNERLTNQHEKHSGGGWHIGQKGYSPFGNAGAKRDGIRVGGEGNHGQAFYVATQRIFKNLREDVALDERNLGIALKKLRYFQKVGNEEEVDLEQTVDKTAKNFGDIEIVFAKERKNNIKLLLLIDNGGSMEPHREKVEKLFSTAKNLRYFKDFQYFYFHNCVYDNIYTDTELWKSIPTAKLFNDFNSDWKLILIGDALMSPYELYNSYQFIYRLEKKGTAGIEWLKRICRHFKYSIWLNPIQSIQWQHQTVKTIRDIFPMFPLTLEGIEQGIKSLLKPH